MISQLKNITFPIPYLGKFKKHFSFRLLWTVSFLCLLVMSVLLLFFDTYVFFSYALSWRDDIPEPEITTITLKKDVLENAMRILEERSQRFLKVGNEGLPIGDPFR